MTIRVAIIVGSTRPGRRAEVVARWVYDIASKRSDAEFEVVDILDFNLPLLDEPMPSSREWNNKAAAFVSYGGASGTRAVEQLRLVMGELQIADVRAQVALSLASDFENYVAFKPAARHAGLVGTMLDQLISWAAAMQTVRTGGEACSVHDTTRNEPFKRGAMEQWHDRASG